MKSSKLRILSILMVGVITLAGCSSAPPNGEKQTTEQQVTAGKRDDTTLTVYIPSWMDRTYLLPGLKTVAFEYESRTNADIDLIDLYTQYEPESAKKLSVELMSGKGPDIMINPGQCFSTLDVHKVMASGVFADLGPLLELEGKGDRYFTKVLASGKYGDEQLIVPLFFSIRCFVSTRDVLEKNHFDINQCGTYDGFLNELGGCLNSATAPPPLIYEQRCQFLYLSDSIYDPPVIDYNNRTVDFSRPGVQKTYEFTKDLMDRYPLSPYGDNYRTPQADDAAGILKSGKALFLANDECGGFGTLNSLYHINIRIEENDQLVMTALRRASDNSVITYDKFSIAVNRNSRNLEAATEFIEYLLSDTVQCNHFQAHLPVYKQGVEARIQSFLAISDLPESILNDYRSVANDVGSVQFNFQFPAMMYELMEPYYLGKESYESCISKVQNRFSIFVDE